MFGLTHYRDILELKEHVVIRLIYKMLSKVALT